MATKKTTSEIDPDKILRTIHAATIGRRAEIDDQLARLRDGDPREYQDAYQRLARERSAAEWMRYSMDDIAGHTLDSAARRRWQRAVAELERLRLVEIVGVRGSAIRLSAKGKKHLRELLAK